MDAEYDVERRSGVSPTLTDRCSVQRLGVKSVAWLEGNLTNWASALMS